MAMSPSTTAPAASVDSNGAKFWPACASRAGSRRAPPACTQERQIRDYQFQLAIAHNPRSGLPVAGCGRVTVEGLRRSASSRSNAASASGIRLAACGRCSACGQHRAQLRLRGREGVVGSRSVVGSDTVDTAVRMLDGKRFHIAQTGTITAKAPHVDALWSSALRTDSRSSMSSVRCTADCSCRVARQVGPLVRSAPSAVANAAAIGSSSNSLTKFCSSASCFAGAALIDQDDASRSLRRSERAATGGLMSLVGRLTGAAGEEIHRVGLRFRANAGSTAT